MTGSVASATGQPIPHGRFPFLFRFAPHLLRRWPSRRLHFTTFTFRNVDYDNSTTTHSLLSVVRSFPSPPFAAARPTYLSTSSFLTSRQSSSYQKVSRNAAKVANCWIWTHQLEGDLRDCLRRYEAAGGAVNWRAYSAYLRSKSGGTTKLGGGTGAIHGPVFTGSVAGCNI